MNGRRGVVALVGHRNVSLVTHAEIAVRLAGTTSAPRRARVDAALI